MLAGNFFARRDAECAILVLTAADLPPRFGKECFAVYQTLLALAPLTGDTTSTPTGLYIALGAAAVLLVALGVFAVLRRRRNK